LAAMSHKSAKIAAMIESFHGTAHDPHYLGYFDCFNRELFYEAHDVLEELWLASRQTSNNLFYKGLIQLAGAFVHLQKNRLRPASALFHLARTNLRQYPSPHEQLNLSLVLLLIEDWDQRLISAGFQVNPLSCCPPPRLALLEIPD
jgi:predicted metal-dependent hydrolase